MFVRPLLLAVLLFAMSGVEALAETLTFQRVFASPNLSGPAPRAAKLSPDGRWLTLLRNRADDRLRYDLWGYDRAAKQWRMLVDSTRLSPGAALSEAEKMQRERLRIGDLKGVVGYQWSEDARSLLVPLDGELFLADLAGNSRRLDIGGGVLDPAISPKSGFVSFLRDRRVWVMPLAGGVPLAITPSESADTVHWGEAEFVAQEEMARQKGLWWSPDDRRLAVERFDEAQVEVVTRAAIGASGTTTFRQRYPAAGTLNVAVALYVLRPDGTAPIKVDLGADPDIYLARVDWAPDGKWLYVQRENRAQTRLDMLRVDPATGAAAVLFSEAAAAPGWINLSDNYRFLDDGGLIWWSERSGFGHLYRFAGGTWTPLTQGDWAVTSLVGVDQKAGRVFFTGNPDDILAPQVLAVSYKTPSRPERLSDPAYVNAATMDRRGTSLIVARSNPMQPPQSYLADTAGKRLAWIEENALVPEHPYAPFLAKHRVPSFGTIAADDGTLLHYRLITPELIPGRRYPVFFEHYGGPTQQTVTRGWVPPLVEAIVARGYVYFELDNRGSPNRGTAFETALARAMGTVEVRDQRAGAQWLKRQDFVDGAKIATFGWSYGGYMTLKMLEADQGLYAAGIAGAPVTRWELYDTHYTERYLGMPQAPGEVYTRADAVPDAGKIADPLLLVHGLADDNVVFENSSELIAAMQAGSTPFEMMLYPGQTHHFAGEGRNLHLWNTIFAFLARHGVAPTP